jgi:hypothetical protein
MPAGFPPTMPAGMRYPGLRNAGNHQGCTTSRYGEKGMKGLEAGGWRSSSTHNLQLFPYSTGVSTMIFTVRE